MISWINFTVLVVSSFLFTFLYIKSVGPAALEKRSGPSAYRKCFIYRIIASAFEGMAGADYVLYYWFPLPLPLPDAFPWPWWISTVIAAVIAVPSTYLMVRGVKDAGEEFPTPG